MTERAAAIDDNMTIVTVILLVGGLVVVLAALLTGLAWAGRGRRQAPDTVTEMQARENAAPLSTAILPHDHGRGRS